MKQYGIVHYVPKGFGSKNPQWDWYDSAFVRNSYYMSMKDRGERVRKVERTVKKPKRKGFVI